MEVCFNWLAFYSRVEMVFGSGDSLDYKRPSNDGKGKTVRSGEPESLAIEAAASGHGAFVAVWLKRAGPGGRRSLPPPTGPRAMEFLKLL